MFWFVIPIDDISFPSITCYEADKFLSRKAELFSKAEFLLKSFRKHNELSSTKENSFLMQISKAEVSIEIEIYWIKHWFCLKH